MELDRLVKLAQFAGALLAIPVAAGGSISLYRSCFSDDVVCQNMRSAILATMDKNVPAKAKLTLLQRDVEQFGTRCAKIDPDANGIFQTAMQQLASQVASPNSAPAAARPPSPALAPPLTTPPPSQSSADASASGIAKPQPKAPEEEPRLDLRRFDGTWVSNVSCAAAAGAQGYSYQFIAQVKDAVFHGQYGIENEPGWTTFDGKIQSDGSADIHAKGLTGQSAFTVGNVSAGTHFDYHITTRFEGSNGTGTRVELRPCNFTFVKK
jgi:hypothetical protein